MSEYILDIQNITKRFPGVLALNDVSMKVKRGDIHALVGENGAGKSTLIKILSGVIKQDSGKFLFKGEEVNISKPLEAQMLGMSVVHQELKLVDTLSVAENVFLGRPKTSGALKLVSYRKQKQEAIELLESLNTVMDVDQLVGSLSVAQKQLVEICKALSYNAELIIMDEPSATLTDKELDILFDILKQLKQNGVTIIYISHRLEEIFALADRVSVLRDGAHIGTTDVEKVNKAELIKMMVGRDLEEEYPKMQVEIGDVAFEVKDLNRGKIIKDINFTLRHGEILGIAGLVGSGRTETARCIFGADKKTSGKFYKDGEEINIKDVATAIRCKIALVPEERKTQGVLLGMSVKENISMAGINKVMRNGFINKKKERELALEYIEKLRILTPNETRDVNDLSGGNQQKVVLAKWLAVDSDIMIFDEPTRGIDVGAKAEIYRLLCQLAAQGKAIIMISSELPEIIGICDRVLVMHDGRITGEVTRQEATQERIMEFATM